MLLIIMKVKMKNRSHRCDINGPKPKHGHNYPNYNTNYKRLTEAATGSVL